VAEAGESLKTSLEETPSQKEKKKSDKPSVVAPPSQLLGGLSRRIVSIKGVEKSSENRYYGT
jgi:hypothetical protein